MDRAQDILVAWLKEGKFVDPKACGTIMEARSVAGQYVEAMDLFTETRDAIFNMGLIRWNVKDALQILYPYAVRLSYPDVAVIRWLVGEMKKRDIPVSKDILIYQSACLIENGEELIPQISELSEHHQHPFIATVTLFHALVMGSNIEQLPRVWRDIMTRVVNPRGGLPPTIPGLKMAVHALSPDADHDFYALLESEEYANKLFSDGRTGAQWAKSMRNVRYNLALKLRKAGESVPTSDNEIIPETWVGKRPEKPKWMAPAEAISLKED
jgi:hypothetical protein